MKRLALTGLALLSLFLFPFVAGAEPLSAYIEPFKVTGAAAEANLPTTLQTLLASRVASSSLQVLDSAVGAQVLIKGSYIQFGKVYSIDVTARDPGGRVLARSYEQGEGQESLLQAVSKLAEKLNAALAAPVAVPPVKPASVPPPPALPIPSQPAAITPPVQPSPPVALPAPAAQPQAAAGSDIVRADATANGDIQGYLPQRLTGEYVGMAAIRTLGDGERELFLVRDRTLQVVRTGARMEQLAEVALAGDEKILAVDAADLDGDGVREAYLTVMRNFELSSQVWVFKDKRLVRAADKLPYYFRSFTAGGNAGKVYAQQSGQSDDYYGPVFELKLENSKYELRNPLKLPKLANIFNFNLFRDRDGNGRIVVLHPDGFLVVFAESGEELWRSNDKFGGSETSFAKNDQQNIQFTGSATRKVFLQQRITVTANGEILVPQNVGFWTIGNSRSFSKNSVFSFAWNGVAFNELWHTKSSQNYLADYLYDEPRKELVLLEVVKREGLLGKGISALSTKKTE
jgi:hypothetical protein